MNPVWFDAQQPGDVVLVAEHRGIGLTLPPRLSDCSGARPSWYPFQINVCDVDDPDPIVLVGRQLTVPNWPEG